MLFGTSASTQTTGIPAAIAALMAGIRALGSQPTTIIPEGFRAVVCSTASTSPRMSTLFGPAMVTFTPSSSPTNRERRMIMRDEKRQIRIGREPNILFIRGGSFGRLSGYLLGAGHSGKKGCSGQHSGGA